MCMLVELKLYVESEYLIKNSWSRGGWQMYIRKATSERTINVSVSMPLKYARHLPISILNIMYRFSVVKFVNCIMNVRDSFSLVNSTYVDWL